MPHHHFFSSMRLHAVVALLALSVGDTWAAGVQVSQAWARSTVAGQQATGAYMSLTSPTALTLVDVTTPAAGIVEVHEMKMDGDVMKMRALPQLPLPAGTTVQLKPGGVHVMMMDLKQPFVNKTRIPVTLHFKDSAGLKSQQRVMVPVSLTAPPYSAGR